MDLPNLSGQSINQKASIMEATPSNQIASISEASSSSSTLSLADDQFYIFARLFSGDILVIDIQSDDTIETLKAKIKKIASINTPFTDITLFTESDQKDEFSENSYRIIDSPSDTLIHTIVNNGATINVFINIYCTVVIVKTDDDETVRHIDYTGPQQPDDMGVCYNVHIVEGREINEYHQQHNALFTVIPHENLGRPFRKYNALVKAPNGKILENIPFFHTQDLGCFAEDQIDGLDCYIADAGRSRVSRRLDYRLCHHYSEGDFFTGLVTLSLPELLATFIPSEYGIDFNMFHDFDMSTLDLE
jgi:hypothetical protein